MIISTWVLVDRDNIEHDDEYDDLDEAIADADTTGCAVVERTYVYNDSELVWTPDGSRTWPPKERTR